MATLVRVDSIPDSPTAGGDAAKTLREFMASDMDRARVDGISTTPKGFAESASRYARRHMPGQVGVRVHAGKVYLERLAAGQKPDAEPRIAIDPHETARVIRSYADDQAAEKPKPATKPKDDKADGSGTVKVRTTGGPVQPSGMAMPRWTSAERDILKTAVASHRTDGGGVDWAKVAKSVTDYGYATRTPAACQGYVFARLKAGRDFYRRPDGSIGVTDDAQ